MALHFTRNPGVSVRVDLQPEAVRYNRFGTLLTTTLRRAIAALVLLTCAGTPAPAAAQQVRPLPPDVTYMLPLYRDYQTASQDVFAEQVRQLRQRFPEGTLVRVGFAVYIDVEMTDWAVATNDPASVHAALASTIQRIDNAIARAQSVDPPLPICLSFLTPIRSAVDQAQAASQVEDRRNMQWYSDNGMAAGWWTYSRYARKSRRVQEAYIREFGRVVAARMQQYPDLVVAATGDGELELSLDRDPILADYSPFTVAEFRDWLHHEGLYADGGVFAGQGSPTRYATLDALRNAFGSSATFTTWDLKYGNWSLADAVDGDPNAVPESQYNAAAWAPSVIAGGFDAPRVRNLSDPWWQLWVTFKATMLWRHNTDFAKWMTSSADATTGATVPIDRWYSDQIPADYLFGNTPDNPNWRYETSASAHWTADVWPYGGMGITAFNVNHEYDRDGAGQPVCASTSLACFNRTLVNVAPVLAARNRRWAITEWNPSAPPATSTVIYDQEMAVVEQYRPSVLIPYAWDSDTHRLLDTGFETALRSLLARIKDPAATQPRTTIDSPSAAHVVKQPFTLSGSAVDLGTVRGPGRTTGVDLVQIYAYPGTSTTGIFLGQATYGSARPDIGSTLGTQFANSGFSRLVTGLAPGPYRLVAFARSIVTGAFSAATLNVNIDLPEIALSRSALRFAALSSGGALASRTSAQSITVSNLGAGPFTWTATATQPWIQVSPASGSGAGTVNVNIVDTGNLPSSGTLSGTISFSAPGAVNAPTILVTLTLQAPGATAPPFGAFDVPTGATDVSGSVVVGGWALDDVEIDRVEVFRDLVPGETDPPTPLPQGHPATGKIYLATAEVVRTRPFGPDTALFVDGARPDIEAAFPTYPWNGRAGWGYLMLTWGLPNQGTGTYTLHAYARDREGQYAKLGERRFTSDNRAAAAVAQKPFGAIDAPYPGEVVSGIKLTGGWALTQPTTCLVTKVEVSVDDGPLQPVIYGDLKPGFDQYFPTDKFANSPNSGAAYFLDSTTLSNGVHQIGYLVTDSCGHQEGIGSRFFSVLNTGPSVTAGSSAAVEAFGNAPDAADVAAVPVVSPLEGTTAPTVMPAAIPAVEGAPQQNTPAVVAPGSEKGQPAILQDRRAAAAARELAAPSTFVLIFNDASPPKVSATISPEPDDEGVIRREATVKWRAEDRESGIARLEGCEERRLARSATIRCTATNGAGLSATKVVSVKIRPLF